MASFLSNITDINPVTLPIFGRNIRVGKTPDIVLASTGESVDISASFPVNVTPSDPGYSTTKNYDIFGSQQADTIVGNNGSNYIVAWDGDDSVRGGLGNDAIFGGNNDDIILGLNGNDFLIGGRGGDSLVGGSGDDTINGDDSSIGNTDRDTLTGDDTLTGPTGRDLFVFSGVSTPDNFDYIVDFASGQDSLQVPPSLKPNSIAAAVTDTTNLASADDDFASILADYATLFPSFSANTAYPLKIQSAGSAFNTTQFVLLIDSTYTSGSYDLSGRDLLFRIPDSVNLLTTDFV